MLVDNCEHLLDACGTMIVELLKSCPQLTIMATSREPIAVSGELSWRVPSLSLADEAVQLFTDRARHVRPNFAVGEGMSVKRSYFRLPTHSDVGIPRKIRASAAWGNSARLKR